MLFSSLLIWVSRPIMLDAAKVSSSFIAVADMSRIER